MIARVFLFKSVRKRRSNSEKNRHSPVCSKKRACAMHHAEEGDVQDGVSWRVDIVREGMSGNRDGKRAVRNTGRT